MFAKNIWVIVFLVCFLIFFYGDLGGCWWLPLENIFHLNFFFSPVDRTENILKLKVCLSVTVCAEKAVFILPLVMFALFCFNLSINWNFGRCKSCCSKVYTRLHCVYCVDMRFLLLDAAMFLGCWKNKSNIRKGCMVGFLFFFRQIRVCMGKNSTWVIISWEGQWFSDLGLKMLRRIFSLFSMKYRLPESKG